MLKAQLTEEEKERQSIYHIRNMLMAYVKSKDPVRFIEEIELPKEKRRIIMSIIICLVAAAVVAASVILLALFDVKDFLKDCCICGVTYGSMIFLFFLLYGIHYCQEYWVSKKELKFLTKKHKSQK